MGAGEALTGHYVMRRSSPGAMGTPPPPLRAEEFPGSGEVFQTEGTARVKVAPDGGARTLL